MQLSDGAGRWLLWSARDAVHRALAVEPPIGPARPDEPRLREPARAFVSWHDGPGLLGCIGTLEASRPLEDAVRHYAVQAAFHDPRTVGVAVQQLRTISCEISVLSDPQPLAASCLAEVEQSIVPGRDGVILRQGHRRAVFLPVVWETLPDPKTFLEALCRKGRFDAAVDTAPIVAEVFTANVLDEGDLPAAPGPG